MSYRPLFLDREKKAPVPKYDYFSKPDGEDVIAKLNYVLQPAAASAFALSTIDVMLMSKPKGYLNILMRYAYITVPFVGGAAAFVATTNLMGAIRKKSDRLNWAVGGMAIGAVIGLWKRKQITGYTCTAIFGFLGYMRKYGADNGFVFIPKNVAHFNLRSGGYDYTLSKDIPGNYTTDPTRPRV